MLKRERGREGKKEREKAVEIVDKFGQFSTM